MIIVWLICAGTGMEMFEIYLLIVWVIYMVSFLYPMCNVLEVCVNMFDSLFWTPLGLILVHTRTPCLLPTVPSVCSQRRWYESLPVVSMSLTIKGHAH